MPHVEVPKDAISAPTLPNGVVNGVTTSPQPEPNGDAAINGTPARPKSQNLNSHIGIPSNGYHLPLSAASLSSAYLPQNGQHAVGGLSVQQVQNLKSAFANLSATEMATLNGGIPLPALYLMYAASECTSIKLPERPNEQFSSDVQSLWLILVLAAN